MKFLWVAVIFMLVAGGVLYLSSHSSSVWETLAEKQGGGVGAPEEIVEKNGVTMAEVKQAVNENLPKLLPAVYGGSVFCAFFVYGFDVNETNNRIEAAVWAYCEEYYKQNNELSLGAGVSEPVKMNFYLIDSDLVFANFEEPISGEDYASSIKIMFPEYAKEILKGYSPWQFSPSPREQAAAYFKS